MIVAPFQVADGEYSIFVVIEEDNLERMRNYDPAEVTSGKFGPPWTEMRLRDVIIGLATREDMEKVTKLFEQQKSAEALRWLSRGFRYRPAKGDHQPYHRHVLEEPE